MEGQGGWLLASVLLYLVLSWLFGSYTVLRWRRLSLVILLQRVLLATLVTVLVLAVGRWFLNPGDGIWLVYRKVQLAWMMPLALWSLMVRISLRRVRLDELPQLWNLLNGTMSLIGPRQERPEYEQELGREVSNYRKRDWMQPGLSGWKQVNESYASSVEDSERKLSYDLYYLKHFRTWLDLLILLKTIKTVLNAGGR